MRYKIVSFALLFIVLTHTALCQSKVTWFASFDFNQIQVNEMPLVVRNVPNHPADSPYGQGPITRIAFTSNDIFNIGITYRYYPKNTDQVYGINLGLLTISSFDDARRNYTNSVGSSSRGYGAALTYCGLRKAGFVNFFGAGSPASMGLVPEIFFENKISKDVSLGCSIGYYILQAQNGWDRFDEFEINKEYTIAHLIPVRIYARIRPSESVSLSAGIGMQNPIYTDLGSTAQVRCNRFLFFFQISG